MCGKNEKKITKNMVTDDHKAPFGERHNSCQAVLVPTEAPKNTKKRSLAALRQQKSNWSGTANTTQLIIETLEILQMKESEDTEKQWVADNKTKLE